MVKAISSLTSKEVKAHNILQDVSDSTQHREQYW